MLRPMSQERRRAARIRCVLPLRLYPPGEAKVIQTLTKDLSEGGLRCLSPVAKPVKTLLSVEIDLGPGKKPLTLRAHTVWFQEIPHSEQFYLGIAFQDLSSHHRELLSRYIDTIVSSKPS